MKALADAAMFGLLVWTFFKTGLVDEPPNEDPRLQRFIEVSRYVVVVALAITFAIFWPLLAFAS